MSKTIYSEKEDVVSDEFQIHLNQPINSLSNEFVNYYLASSVNEVSELNDEKKYFAIVFNPNFYYSLNNINKLLNLGLKNLICPIAYGISKLSINKSYTMVVIIKKYDHENSLKKIIHDQGELTLQQVKKLLHDLVKVITTVENYGLCCGNININNIYYHDGYFILREFFISPANFYQEESYLAPELLQCMSYGRVGTNDDVYALGVVLFYAMFGKQIWADNFKSINDYNIARLRFGTFELLMQFVPKNSIFSHNLKILLNGILQNSIKKRWKVDDINKYLEGVRYDFISSDDIKDEECIAFDDVNCYNFKQLAYCLYDNWNDASYFINNDKLLKNELRSYTSDINKGHNTGGLLYKFNHYLLQTRKLDVKTRLSKILLLIDKEGPIRIENFCISLYSIPNLIFYSICLENKFWLFSLYKIIQNELESFYFFKSELKIDLIKKFKTIKNWNIDDIEYFSKKMCYFLNTDLHCLSPLVINYYVFNIPVLIEHLEIAARDKADTLIIDSHILSFIEVRLDINNYFLLSDGEILTYREVFILFIMLHVKEKYPKINMQNLSIWISNKIRTLLLKYLHNNSLKEKIKEDILNHGQQGNLSEIFDILSNKNLFKSDLTSYHNACKDIEVLNQKILEVSDKTQNLTKGLLIGQTLTVFVSYILFLFIAMSLLF